VNGHALLPYLEFVIEIYSVDNEPTSKKNAPRQVLATNSWRKFKETDQSND
ncbi:hypothetical protein CEXT_631631, partial [Caerostris extrusa]